MHDTFTPSHRGGSGPPMVCLHGFTDTWRTWELVLPRSSATTTCWPPRCPATPAARRSRARSPTRCSPTRSSAPWTRRASRPPTSSATRSAATSRCSSPRAAGRESVVALAPAGGWAAGDESFRETLDHFVTMQELLRAAAPARRGDRSPRRRAGAARPQFIADELRAHPGRAARPPDARRAALRGRAAADRARAARGLDRSTPSGSPARCGSCGAPHDRLLAGRRPPRASATTGCRTPTGSSSTASATAPSSTSRSRRRELILGFTAR